METITWFFFFPFLHFRERASACMSTVLVLLMDMDVPAWLLVVCGGEGGWGNRGLAVIDRTYVFCM